jgi:hypothetical protein
MDEVVAFGEVDDVVSGIGILEQLRRSTLD